MKRRASVVGVGGGTRAAVIGVLIVAAALGLRLGYVAATPDYELRHDARDYDVHAVSMIGAGPISP